jgi:hypothetical protein
MNTLRFAKGCRLAGKLALICAVIFLIGNFVELHIERSHRTYVFPEGDEQRIVTCYLGFLGACGLGCFLLWLGSFFGPKNPADLI